MIDLPNGFVVSAEAAFRWLLWKYGFDPANPIPPFTPLAAAELRLVPYAAYDGVPDVAPNDITLLDLAVTMGMNSLANASAVTSLERSRRNEPTWDGVRNALADIPVEASILDYGEYDLQCRTIFGVLLNTPYFQTARLFKVLARKRRYLFPMWDRRMADFAAQRPLGAPPNVFPVGAGIEGALSALGWCREAVLYQENQGALEQVEQQFTEGGLQVSPLRALDQLIWLYGSQYWNPEGPPA